MHTCIDLVASSHFQDSLMEMIVFTSSQQKVYIDSSGPVSAHSYPWLPS